jgi:hypothetical protein
MIERSGVLRVADGRFAAGAPGDLDGRSAVVAVGSNASAGVLLWKLRQGGVGGEVPLVRAGIRDLLVAPSAHVGRPGFVPAAPAHAEGAVSEVVVGWLDRDQLDCVDRTEPNYRRVGLAPGRYVLEPEFAVPDEDLEVYDSVWGVLADSGGPIRLTGQAELATWLAQRELPPWKDHDAAEAVARLAGSIELRERARDGFRGAGLTAGSGLVSRPGR